MLPSGPAGSGSLHQPAGEEVVLRKKKRCRVLFSYQPLHDDELELKVKLFDSIKIQLGGGVTCKFGDYFSL